MNLSWFLHFVAQFSPAPQPLETAQRTPLKLCGGWVGNSLRWVHTRWGAATLTVLLRGYEGKQVSGLHYSLAPWARGSVTQSSGTEALLVRCVFHRCSDVFFIIDLMSAMRIGSSEHLDMCPFLTWRPPTQQLEDQGNHRGGKPAKYQRGQPKGHDHKPRWFSRPCYQAQDEPG